MARIVFLQLNDYELHGPQSIAAVLKSRGHDARLVVPGLTRDPMGDMIRLRPQVVGIGHATVEREEALIWAKAVKDKLGCKVIFGGIDPTFRPESALEPGVDAVVRGEGEEALLAIMDRVEAGEDFPDVPGIVTAQNHGLRINPPGLFPKDLDSLPFPDKDLYLGTYRHFRDYPIKFFMASRGCPHQCRYCANKELSRLVDDGHYVRFKSPEYFIAEIKRALAKYPARTVGFNDDLFTHRMKWLEEFLPRYKAEIGVPFFCTTRIDAMSDGKARLLAECGCYTAWYGLESANPRIREQVLGRRMDNERIREGVEILHRHGILTQSYNMINLPGQTFEDAIDTLKFNHEIKNDFVVASMFQPFPGTELQKDLIAEKKIPDPQVLGGRKSVSYFAFSPLVQDDSKRLSNLQKFFITAHRFPALLPLIKILCGLPPNLLFDILFIAHFAADYKKSHRLKWWEVGYFNLRHLFTTYIARVNRLPED